MTFLTLNLRTEARLRCTHAHEDELTRKTRAENDAEDSSEWTLNKKMHGTKN